MELKQRVILEDSLGYWLKNFKMNSVKPSTYDRLKISYKLLRHYPIALMELDTIDCIDIQTHLNRVLKDGYSLSSIKKQYTLLTDYFKFAFAQKQVNSPVYIGVELPTEENVLKHCKEIEVYSGEEQERLFNVLSTLEHPSYGVTVLMLDCGLRIGEALALSWGDIDFKRRSITICKTYVKLSMSGGYSFVQNSPKSKSSRRVIPIGKRAYDLFKFLYSLKGKRTGLIFPSDKDVNTPMSYATVRYYMKTACDKADVEYKGNHVFRHTFATNCYYKGCNVKLLSKLLGHSNVTITYNTYIHLYGDSLEEMRSIVDK